MLVLGSFKTPFLLHFLALPGAITKSFARQMRKARKQRAKKNCSNCATALRQLSKVTITFMHCNCPNITERHSNPTCRQHLHTRQVCTPVPSHIIWQIVVLSTGSKFGEIWTLMSGHNRLYCVSNDNCFRPRRHRKSKRGRQNKMSRRVAPLLRLDTEFDLDQSMHENRAEARCAEVTSIAEEEDEPMDTVEPAEVSARLSIRRSHTLWNTRTLTRPTPVAPEPPASRRAWRPKQARRSGTGLH